MSWVGPGRAWPRSRACLKIGRAGMFDVGTGVLIDDSTRVGRMSKGADPYPGAGALKTIDTFSHGGAGACPGAGCISWTGATFPGPGAASTITALGSRSILEGDDHRNVIGSSLAFAFVTVDLRGGD